MDADIAFAKAALRAWRKLALDPEHRHQQWFPAGCLMSQPSTLNLTASSSLGRCNMCTLLCAWFSLRGVCGCLLVGGID